MRDYTDMMNLAPAELVREAQLALKAREVPKAVQAVKARLAELARLGVKALQAHVVLKAQAASKARLVILARLGVKARLVILVPKDLLVIKTPHRFLWEPAHLMKD